MSSRTYFIHTFGCQSNKSDSERVAGDYEARGFVATLDWHKADEIIVNTCAIRQSAEDRVKGFLLNVVKYFTLTGKKRPKIILTGCMTHHGATKLYEILPMVDEILPINEVGFNQAAVRKDKKHAWVPISAGCNSFCTYCIVPYSRGREQSRSMESILEEVERLANSGFSEVTLLGQNVNSWGLEKEGIGMRKMLMRENQEQLSREEIPDNSSQYEKADGVPPFVDLLREVSKFPQIKVIRFLTSNPWDFPDSLICEIANNPKIDRFIHLPVQSGSNSVLYRMNRGYTKEHYRELIRKLRSKVPDVVIGSDIIVGFSGETVSEFEETVEFAKEMDWKLGFVAQYSPRPGTAGFRLYADDVPQKEKKRRWEILDQIINKDNLSMRPKVV
ncbi:MAG TPA: MiaB/RimO family radical SAM methylthiotransferase [Patescibacteria group bacterium]|nr:MiaB/RimO family radical SAM methylthiotransferase [Patescibacteria group bacterium]